MPVSVLEPSDVSASASDFQPDGTAAPGETGRVADAGHVHPASAPSLGYQVVTQVVQSGLINVTVQAPAGCVVVGGGYSRPDGAVRLPWQTNAPTSDGSGWVLKGQTGDGYTTTVYAICVNA